MIDNLIFFSIKNKLTIGLFTLALIGWGVFSFKHIPIDAVPDITTNQVLIITQSPTLAAQEVEQFVTFPIEIAMSNLPDVEEIRSISRFGLSVITVVFHDNTDIYLARQLISEQLKIAEGDIPESFGKPELGPITTGLGEVYQYVLHTAEGYEDQFSDMDLREINDWIVKRQLAGTPGVIEVSSLGGHLKQYEVSVNPALLKSMNLNIFDVFDALEKNNENTGGSYIEKRFNTYFIRGEGLVSSLSDIESIVVKTVDGFPVLIRDIAEVGFGSAPRYGAITYNGKGEVVGGQVLMLKGHNSYEVVQSVKERIEKIRKSLPEGVILEPYLDRSELIGRAINTVTNNLVEGGLIVIFILILLLGNLRGGLIVASVIPLSMLFAMGMMNVFGVSANLMSLGAIDFGLVVDGSVIIVESIVHRLTTAFRGRVLSKDEMNSAVLESTTKFRKSATFGVIIILIVYLPILALVGIEGKTFKPMAQTVSFAILGALVLSMTYVPMMSALILKRKITEREGISAKIIEKLRSWYSPLLIQALKRKPLIILSALTLFLMSLVSFSRLGGEFIPTLEEGDFALHQILPAGSSLQQSIEVSQKIQQTLLDNFPEVEKVVSKIGTSEIPTDPMPIEVGDIMVIMKPKAEWTSAKTMQGMFELMEQKLSDIPGVDYEFTQPIQMRFNELIAGVREDIAIKVFGEDPEKLFIKAKEIESIIAGIDGVGDLRVEQTQGLPQMIVRYDRKKLAQHGLNIRDLNLILRASFAGEKAGVVFEGERRFDLVVRLDKNNRQEISDLKNLFVPLPNGNQIPLIEVASIDFEDGPMQISRDNAKRRIVVGVNSRNRDMESLVQEIQDKLDAELILEPGYALQYGGKFENLQAAKKRLSVAVPVALLLIFVMLFFAFNSLRLAMLIFSAIPLSAIGGVYALWIRDMPFSISAGIGFIALFGVAVLNGIVLISYFAQLEKEGMTDIHDRIIEGTKMRLRPVLMTASVAALGFLPMAISSSAGAEVQRPLATVVIGGLISATFLTLFVLPVLYSLFGKRTNSRSKVGPSMTAVLILCALGWSPQSIAQAPPELDLKKAVEWSLENHPSLKVAQYGLDKQKALKKSSVDLEKTEFIWTKGQINSGYNDYQFQLVQGMRFPTNYISRAKLLEEQIELSSYSLASSELELEYRVHSAWWKVAHANEQLILWNSLVEIYEKFAKVSQARFSSGEINILEKTSAEGQYRQIRISQQQAEANCRIAFQELVRWLGTDSSFVFPADAFKRIEMSAVADSSILDNPLLMFYDQRTSVATQAYKFEKTGYLPDLSIGYFNQQIDGYQGFNGFLVGAKIPLFFWTQQANVQSARLESSIAESEYEDQLLYFQSLYVSRMEQLRTTSNQLKWFEDEGLKTSKELVRFAEGGYRAGEIDYLEYINSTRQAMQIQTDYLNALLDYNQAVIDLQYLVGNINY